MRPQMHRVFTRVSIVVSLWACICGHGLDETVAAEEEAKKSMDGEFRWFDQDTMVRKSLVITPHERTRLRGLETAGVQVIRPVALPRGKALVGANRHLGWPVAIRVGATLLCAHHRIKCHTGSVKSRMIKHHSHAVLLRSEDNGETWSDPLDMQDVGVSREPTVLGFGNCFGVLGKTAFLATRYGLYASEDEGKNWRLIPGALTEKKMKNRIKVDMKAGYAGNFGPRMIVHPEKGLVIPSGVRDEPVMDLFYSMDQGKTWSQERVDLPKGINPQEPTGLFHNGRLIFLTRNHTLPFRGLKQLREPQRPALMVSKGSWFPMAHQAMTNITSYRWPDTTDVDWNPVTKRYEAVVTNRSGGGPGAETNELKEKTVNLWSMAPDDLYAGRAKKWRFEGTLLRWKHGSLEKRPEGIDSAHPGGAVMDAERGVQHIFIHSGTYATPTGSYRITRTLSTPKWRAACLSLAAEEQTKKSKNE